MKKFEGQKELSWWCRWAALAGEGGVDMTSKLALMEGNRNTGEDDRESSMLVLTAVLENPASLITRLTLGSSRIDNTSCSNSTWKIEEKFHVKNRDVF